MVVAVPVKLFLGGIHRLAVNIDEALVERFQNRFDAGAWLNLEPALGRDIGRIGGQSDRRPYRVMRAVAKLQAFAFGILIRRLNQRAQQLD